MYYYIVNPAAGRNQSQNLQAKLRSLLDEIGLRGEWVKTTGPGDGAKLAAAAAAKGFTTIIAVGGDDTINEVINGVEDDKVAIGVIPTGHTNSLAAQLGITNWQQGCRVAAARKVTSFGLIAAGQHYFLSTLTLGFETDLDKRLDTSETSWSARIGQLTRSWGHASAYQTLHARIKVDDSYELECDLFTLTVSNQKFINPLADNKLLISLADRPSKRQLGSYLWELVRNGNSPLDDTATTRFAADRVVIETDPPTGIQLDGKIATRTPIAIRLTDRRVRLITEKLAVGLKL